MQFDRYCRSGCVLGESTKLHGSTSQTMVLFSSKSHRPYRAYIVLLSSQCDYLTYQGHVNEHGSVRSLGSHRSRFKSSGRIESL